MGDHVVNKKSKSEVNVRFNTWNCFYYALSLRKTIFKENRLKTVFELTKIKV